LRVISGAAATAALGVAVLAARRRFTRPVIAYVGSGSGSGSGPGAVTPIRTASNTAKPPITVGTGPDAIAIT